MYLIDVAFPAIFAVTIPPQDPRPAATPMDTPGMERMSEAVTSAAQMCQAMMEKEMAAMPVKMTLIALGGLLLLAALALFIVLEIQWIRYWHRRLRRG